MRLVLVPAALLTLSPWWHQSLSAQFGPLQLVARTETELVLDALPADVDADGDKDLWALDYWGSIVLFRNDGTGDLGRAEDAARLLGKPRAWTWADLDQDGHVDFLGALRASTDEPDTLVWWRNDGDGHFPERRTIAPFSDYTLAVAVADLNGDGLMDILCGDGGDQVLAWFPNLGGMTFGPPQTIISGYEGPTAIATGDLDGDGDPDVALGTEYDNRLAWFANDGLGGFTLGQDIASYNGGVYQVILRDAEGDGDLDLYHSSEFDQIQFYTNNGSGVLSLGTELSIGGTTTFGFDRINGDGFEDVWSVSTSLVQSGAAWASGDGAGGFGTPVNLYLEPGTFTKFLAWADIDGDGALDMISSDREKNALWYRPNGGNGNFGSSNTIISQSMEQCWNVRTADMDGDGDLDIVAAPAPDFKFCWLENTGTSEWPEHNIKPASTTSPNWSKDMICLDMEGDGDTDVLCRFTTGVNSHAVAWRVNDGTGTAFTSGPGVNSYTNSYSGEWLMKGDLNGDLITDHLQFFGRITYSQGLPGGGFANQVWLDPQTYGDAEDGDIGDIDGDGDMDVLAFFTYPNPGLGFLENNGAMSFAAPQLIPGTQYAHYYPRLRDMDGDGDLDAFAYSPNAGCLVWYENDAGSFPTDHPIMAAAVSEAYNAVLASDLDGDGDVDVLAPSLDPAGGGIPMLLLNHGDGTFAPPVLLYEGHLGLQSSATGDLNNDGHTDLVMGLDGSSIYITFGYGGSAFQLQGRVFIDTDGDGAYGSGEPGLAGTQLTLDPPTGSVLLAPDGSFTVLAVPGSYTLSATAPSQGWMAVGPSSYTASLSIGTPVVDSLFFGFTDPTPNPAVVPFIGSSLLVCTGPAPLWMTVTNTGSVPLSGLAKFALDPLVNLNSAHPPPDAIIGDTLVWNFSDLAPGVALSHEVEVVMPGIGYDGTTLNNSAHVDANGGGSTVSASHVSAPVITCNGASNVKLCEPYNDDLYNTIPASTPYMDYTILFQNTGTDTVHLMTLTDSFDPLLDTDSLLVTGSSHPITAQQMYVNGNVHGMFVFNDINLPPITTDPVGSQGFLSLRVPLKSGPHMYFLRNSVTILTIDNSATTVDAYVQVLLVDCDQVDPQVGETIVWNEISVFVPDDYSAYQWYLNGTPLPNGSQWYYSPTVSGQYSVQVTDLAGCVVLSDPYTFVFTGELEQQADALSVHPNPASDNVRIVPGTGQVIGRWELFDGMGHRLRSSTVGRPDDLVIERGGFASGVYVLRVFDNDDLPLGTRVFLFH